MGEQVGGRSKREKIYVYTKLITDHCKAIIRQPKDD